MDKNKNKKDASKSDGESVNALIRTMNETMLAMRGEMVTQKGMNDYRDGIMSECKSIVTSEVMPVREDVDRVAASVRQIQKYIKETESKNVSHEALLINDRTDRDKCKVSFKGFQSPDLKLRADAMCDLARKYPQYAHFPPGHTFKGPYGSRKLTNESFLEFPNEDLAMLFSADIKRDCNAKKGF